MEASRVRSCIAVYIGLVLLVGKTSLAEAPKENRTFKTAVVESQKVTVTDKYLCKIHGQRHIKLRVLDKGYLKTIAIKEGQTVKQGDVLFEITPIGDSEQADAKAKPASVTAPFDGIVGRMETGEGALVLEGEPLTTLSDNTVVWVYFEVPESRYLRFMAERNKKTESPRFELTLADGKKFDQAAGKLGAIEAEFNSNTDKVFFRADFPNPQGLLRHRQTGAISMIQVLTDAIVVPLSATFEQAEKRYVYVVDKSNVVHLREIIIQNELEKRLVLQTGLDVGERIVLEDVSQLHDGDKIEVGDR